MKMPNLTDLMISISDFKKQLSEVINKQMTKVIVKNNVPISVIMPYENYTKLNADVIESREFLKGVGQEITLSNGVQIMVAVETLEHEIALKTYIKMSNGDYKLHYTLRLSNPNKEQTLTHEELMKFYGLNNN